MRYPTLGDYFFHENTLVFEVVRQKDLRYEILIFIHELVEWILVNEKGIPIEDIDAFDKDFEKNRIPGDFSEPGDDVSAPYYHQHQWATIIEKTLAFLLGVKWPDYEMACIKSEKE